MNVRQSRAKTTPPAKMGSMLTLANVNQASQTRTVRRILMNVKFTMRAPTDLPAWTKLTSKYQ